MQTHTAIALTAPVPSADLFIRRIWPPAMIVLGLGLTATWISLLGYGLVTLIEFVI